MAVVRNLIANSLNQGVSFLTNILAVPIYLSQLGVEQYGLVGFAIVVQTWVNLLEVGMSGTLGREMTRLMIGDVSEASVHSFVRSLDWLFLGVLIALPGLGWMSRSLWAQDWFTNHTLPPALINECVVLIIALAGVRLAGTLYRGGLMGLDRQVFVSGISIAGSITRLVLPLPFIWAVPDVRIVIGAWLAISFVELIVLRLSLSQAFSTRFHWRHFSIAELRQRAQLWASIGYLSVAWTAITQTDKLVLSRVMPLADYGRFTLVMILSNAVLTIATPISFAFQPRITSAATRGDREELAQLVRNSTRIMMVLMVGPAIAMAAVPRATIFAWTGNLRAAEATSAYLGPYVLGSALVSFAGIAYAIQYAFGDLKLHVRAYTIFAVILIPAEIVVAARFGPLGASWLWLALNFLTLIFYCPLVFHRFLPRETRQWFIFIIAPPALASATTAWVMSRLLDAYIPDRNEAILHTVATGMAVVAAAAVVTLFLYFRDKILRRGNTVQSLDAR